MAKCHKETNRSLTLSSSSSLVIYPLYFGIHQTIVVPARQNRVRPPHLAYFYTVAALSLRHIVPSIFSLFLSFPISRSLSFPPFCRRLFSRSLPCVYQVIGCEMKSNENPFRRVHSRSAVGRVAQAHPPLASPPLIADTAHLRFSSCSPSATSGNRRPVCIMIAAR